jgi:hypothetical protein
MLYTKNLILPVSSICFERCDIWLAYVPLHYFDIVEMHCPDLIIQQFGLSYHIPGRSCTILAAKVNAKGVD